MSKGPGRLERSIEEPRRKKLPGNTSVSVIQKCKDAKWRSATEVATRAGILEAEVARVMHTIRTTHKHRASVETKKVGGAKLITEFSSRTKRSA